MCEVDTAGQFRDICIEVTGLNSRKNSVFRGTDCKHLDMSTVVLHLHSKQSGKAFTEIRIRLKHRQDFIFGDFQYAASIDTGCVTMIRVRKNRCFGKISSRHRPMQDQSIPVQAGSSQSDTSLDHAKQAGCHLVLSKQHVTFGHVNHATCIGWQQGERVV